MSDKDQFTFEDEDDFSESLVGDEEEPPKFDLGDDDDFPETDLSAAFSDGEHEVENPAPDVAEEPAPKKKKGLFGMGTSDKPKKEKKPKKAKKEKPLKPEKEKKSGGGGSSSRILLLVLLLVVAGGAGAYFFMDLGVTTPSVPTVPAPAQKATKTVALPPKPAKAPAPAKVSAPEKPAAASAKAPAPASQTKPAGQPEPVSVAVPPPSKPAPKPVAAKPAPAAKPQPAAVTKSAQKPAAEKPQQAPAKKAEAAAKASAPAPQPKAAGQKQVAEAPTKPQAKVVAPVKQVPGGAYALDAGSYLLEANRKALVAKIEKLGYKPLVTPVDAKLNMTRLRLGTFSKTEVKEALAFARSIEPGSYSSPAGDGYVIYAGTFLKEKNVDKLTQRFLEEGTKVRPEPVEVVRTLSRIRFGSFASKEDAAAAAVASEKAGVKAVVVKSK